MGSLKEFLKNVNLFEPDPHSGIEEDEHQKQSNLLATRIYLITLITVLSAATFVLWSYPEKTIVIIEHPTQDQFKTVPSDAQCSCSQISISYGTFTNLTSTFHPICSSDFVTDRWIRAINIGSNATYFYIRDFRTSGSAQFQALAGFCRLSQQNVLQNIASFARDTLISPQVLSETELRSKVNAAVSQFQITAPNAFASQLQLVRQMTMSNGLLSAIETNYLPAYYVFNSGAVSISIGLLFYDDIDGFECNCGTDLDCQVDSGLYDIDATGNQFYDAHGWLVPGMSSGCLPVNMILSSTLQCFYHEICLDKVLSYFPTTERFSTIPIFSHSNFPLNTTMKSLVDRLMVEDWMTVVSYDRYYSECAPSSCTYSKNVQHDGKFLIIEPISLLSGVSLILGLFIPIVVNFFRRRPQLEVRANLPLRIKLLQLRRKLQKIMIESNMFTHHPSDERQIRYQRYGTRLYILLLVISLIVFTGYLALVETVYRETVLKPTQPQFFQLDQMYSSSLSCPCTSISIPYSNFISIQAHYHQVCSSDFVSQSWSNYLYTNIPDPVWYLDYQNNAPGQFQLLVMFCDLSEKTIDNALSTFLQTSFVTSQVLSQQLFTDQANSLMETWQLTTINRFLATVDLVRSTTQGNQLLNDELNGLFTVDSQQRTTTISARSYDNCSCALSQSSRLLMSIYDYQISPQNLTLLYTVPNFYLGCFPIEALLASTLECFYNYSCLLAIDGYTSHVGGPFDYIPLDSRRNDPTELIESLVNHLMVNSWSKNSSFTAYYNACAPSSCTYEYTRRSRFFLLITSVIGVFGGLSLGLKILILLGLRLIEKLLAGVHRFGLRNTMKYLFNFSNEQQRIRRLHLLLVLITLQLLYFFSAFQPKLVIVNIEKPSLSIYQNLELKASRSKQSLECVCTKFSIKQQTFLTVEPHFHPVCQSDFVTPNWISYLYGEGNLTNRFQPTDFRYSAVGQFQLLASLCNLTQKTVRDGLTQLGQSDFINGQLLSSSAFQDRIAIIIRDFQVALPELFLSALSLIRETTGANMLMTVFSTNWLINTPSTINNQWTVHTTSLMYQGCDCAWSSKCVQPSRGMFAGCYPLEALLQATFQCLYDAQCIDPTGTFRPMVIPDVNSTSANFNLTIESWVKQLMVEEYISNVSYENYFAECAPSSCKYLYIDQTNLIDGLTILISLYGGLVIICRVIAVMVVQLFQCRTRQVMSLTATAACQ